MRGASVLALCCLVLAGPALAITLDGLVRDAAGAPVPDAVVWCVQEGQVFRLPADDAGRFVFEPLAPAPIQVVALAPGHALGGYTGLPVADTDLTIDLAPAQSLAIRVFRAEGGPAAGARVRTMRVNGRFVVPAALLARHGFPLWRAGDNGEIVLESLPAGGYIETVFSHLDHADTRVSYLPIGEASQQVRLTPGYAVRGRVLADGEPRPGARVVAYEQLPGGQNVMTEVLSDAEGFYALRLAAGAYLLTAKHLQHAPAEPRRVTVAPGMAEPFIDLPLLLRREVDGRVLLPEGDPAPGVRIAYRVDDTIYDETYTGPGGAFRLVVGPPQGELLLQPPPGYMTEVAGPVDVDLQDARRAQLDPIRLKPLARLRGVVQHEGQPVARAVVAVRGIPMPVFALTDTAGQFEIQLGFMPPGQSVQVIAEHPRRFLRDGAIVQLAEAGPLTLDLTPYTPGEAEAPPPHFANDLERLVGEPAPPLQCRTWLNGDPLDWDALRGRVVVLTFWGAFDQSQYGISRMWELNALRAALEKADDVAFLGLHDASLSDERVEEAIEGLGIEYPVGIDDDPFATFVAYGINFIPQTVVVDREGMVRHWRVDGRLHELIKRLRREAPAP